MWSFYFHYPFIIFLSVSIFKNKDRATLSPILHHIIKNYEKRNMIYRTYWLYMSSMSWPILCCSVVTPSFCFSVWYMVYYVGVDLPCPRPEMRFSRGIKWGFFSILTASLKEDYLPLNLFTYIMNIYVICYVYCIYEFPKKF